MSSLVCTGAVVTGILQTNGRKAIVGLVASFLLASLSGVTVTPAGTPTVPSTSITFSANQTLPAGFPIVFASQPGTTYYLAAAISGVEAAVLTEEFTGPAGASVVSSPGFKVLTSSDLGVFNCVGADRQPVQFVAVAASTLVP